MFNDGTLIELMPDKHDLELVRVNFGRAAGDYVSSPIHAKGRSLTRLVEIVEFGDSWKALDIATGAGHTALAIAPYVDEIIATDITFQMVSAARKLGEGRGVTIIHAAAAAADQQPFAKSQFDLVTCRIAAHHFPSIGSFIAESRRLLRPGGILAVVDNISPADSRDIRKSKRDRDPSRYINALEKYRDKSHWRMLSEIEWVEEFYQAGFRTLRREKLEKTLDYESWRKRMNVTGADELRLRSMLMQAPETVHQYLKPRLENGRLIFNLTELIIVGVWEP
jgi:ubiquinone/menaquinone biosynthesis C-methylase UbiE